MFSFGIVWLPVVLIVCIFALVHLTVYDDCVGCASCFVLFCLIFCAESTSFVGLLWMCGFAMLFLLRCCYETVVYITMLCLKLLIMYFVHYLR